MLEFQQFDPIKLPLIKRFYKMYYPATKPKRDESIIVGLDKTEIIAVVRFRTVGSSRLLTGMAVKTEQRQQTIGQQLLRYCQTKWLDQTTFCFAYSHLVDFYQHGGFTPVEPAALPTELETLYQRYLQSGKDLIPMQYQAKLCQE